MLFFDCEVIILLHSNYVFFYEKWLSQNLKQKGFISAATMKLMLKVYFITGNRWWEMDNLA